LIKTEVKALNLATNIYIYIALLPGIMPKRTLIPQILYFLIKSIYVSKSNTVLSTLLQG